MTCPEEITFVLYEQDDSMPEDDGFPAEDGPYGYCVAIKTPQGTLYLNGSEQSDIGYESADEAIAAVKKWCLDRGYDPPFVRFKLTAKHQ